MKRALLWSATWFVSLGGLTGCPVYPEGDACVDDSDCPRAARCEWDEFNTARCVTTEPERCSKPSDCPSNYTCARDRVCRPGSCYFEANGCAPGYACTQSGGVWACVRPDTTIPDASVPLDAGGAFDSGTLTDASSADVSEHEDAAVDAVVPDAPVTDGARDARSDAAARDASRPDAANDAAR